MSINDYVLNDESVYELGFRDGYRQAQMNAVNAILRESTCLRWENLKIVIDDCDHDFCTGLNYAIGAVEGLDTSSRKLIDLIN